MRRKLRAICLVFVIGSIFGCGDARRSQAVEECKRLVMAEAEEGQVKLWFPVVGFSEEAVCAINEQKDWEVVVTDRPISQADKMKGIEWKADIDIVYALDLCELSGWTDMLAMCYAEEKNGTLDVLYAGPEIIY